MKKLVLYKNGKPSNDYALVDDEDYDKCIYCLKPNNHWGIDGEGYPRSICILKGECVNITLHRLILGNCEGFVDHADRNKLNNTKINLRHCNAEQNTRNRRKKSTSQSLYKGVTCKEIGRRCKAYIYVKGKTLQIGRFDTEEDAAKAYDIHALYYFKEFAFLNFEELRESYLKELEVGYIPAKYITNSRYIIP